MQQVEVDYLAANPHCIAPGPPLQPNVPPLPPHCTCPCPLLQVLDWFRAKGLEAYSISCGQSLIYNNIFPKHKVGGWGLSGAGGRVPHGGFCWPLLPHRRLTPTRTLRGRPRAAYALPPGCRRIVWRSA